MVRPSPWFVALCLGALAAPLPAQTSKLLADDAAAFDQTGFSVAVDGRRVVVGSHLADGADFNTGKVYVWRTDGTTWELEDQVAPDDAYINDRFGLSLHLEDDLLLVGSDASESGTAESQGAVYVYRSTPGGFVQEDRLAPASLTPLSRFGTSIDGRGDRLVVGAPTKTNQVDQDGSVYLFRRENGVWIEELELRPDDFQEEHLFGHTVQIDGRLLAVGALGDNQVTVQAGAVYLYERDVAGDWQLLQKVIPPDIEFYDAFGSSLALDGEWLVVGSPSDDDDGIVSGSVYVYRRGANGFTLFDKITAPDAKKNARFGRDLALDGDGLVIGALNAETAPGFAGSTYVYGFGGRNWRFLKQQFPTMTAFGGEYGISVDIDGDLVVGGAYLDAGQVDGGGAAYVTDLRAPSAPAASSLLRGARTTARRR